MPRTIAHVSSGVGNSDATGGINGPDIVLLRKKAKGFQPEVRPESRELQPVVPGFSKQGKLFKSHLKNGVSVSEVFIRFPGITPWKRLGEVTSTTGDFKEAVRSQWLILMEHAYYLYRKIRFWLPTNNPVQIGYTNEAAKIVAVKEGALYEGFSPLVLKEMLERSGFQGAKKAKEWGHMHTKVKEWQAKNTKKGRLADPNKRHLLDAAYQKHLGAYKRYNPHKYRGRYLDYLKNKQMCRTLVIGNGPSR